MSDQRMDSSAFLLILFLSSLFVCHNGVEGSIELSASEDLELENQVKLLNKPAVKTIQTEYGDIYDCVDFYNQPAFDHPMLKNHSFYFEMKPTPWFPRKRDQVRSKVRESLHIRLKDGGCPFGTVPIRRITKEDLIRERNVSNIRPLDEFAFGSHFAVVRTKRGAGKYNGAGAALSIHRPRLLRNDQYSAGRIRILNGVDAIQVGWRVDPGLYGGDTRTRSFIRVDAPQAHCFNTRCPGFVLVRSDIPPDFVYEQTSKYGGPIYQKQLYIKRDLANGNWWLLIGDDFTPVGFWPKRIFSDLANLANYVDWGGHVYTPLGTGFTPEMGTGHFLKTDGRYDAFCRNTQVINEYDQNVDEFNTETFHDIGLYEVVDLKNARKYGHVAVYGGPPQK
ncbi:protein neprosin-like [Rhododendron vialii]|uniref:protein neprosin-like n=1 Tax=Rhododendron vialii TaxID=182163 RepID=UPI00265EF831|nr:protein neprosin-like [Rhododendron vialii]